MRIEEMTIEEVLELASDEALALVETRGWIASGEWRCDKDERNYCLNFKAPTT